MKSNPLKEDWENVFSKIDDPSYDRIFKESEMLIQIHNKLKEYRLREGFKKASDFDVSKVVNPASINKWSNKSNMAVLKAAKKGDKTALEYLFWKMKGAIT